MEGIFETNDSFDFSKLFLTKPTMISGGNYFIRCLVDNLPLYIQPPKCRTKQGILKAGKRFYTDLMFTNENEDFIRWMENLENHCQQYIFKNREKWFDGDMELHDVENYFTSPLKLYKSGKFYIARANLAVVLNKPTLKIYDENENEINMDAINDKTSVITILEIQGIKCSARSFQIELEVKQMMVLKQNNLFEKCIIAPSKKNVVSVNETTDQISSDPHKIHDEHTSAHLAIKEEEEEKEDIIITTNVSESDIAVDNINGAIENTETVENNTIVENSSAHESNADESSVHVNAYIDNSSTKNEKNEKEGLEEVTFSLDELKNTESLQLKKRNDVYYEMYREARRKAKIAKDLALSSYLEAKRIKNMYMLDDINESDDSDLEIEDNESLEN
jgi:hypothetical protein